VPDHDSHPDTDELDGGDALVDEDERASRRIRLAILWFFAAVVVLSGTLVVLSAVGGGGTADAADLAGAPGDGSPAPDFRVTFFDGTEFRLSDHLRNDGRPVFLNLWASWCPPCREEMPDLSEAAVRYPGVQFVGVAVSDDPGEARSFGEAIEAAYPLGADSDGSVDRAYPAPGLPATYVIDGNGRLVRTVFGLVTGPQVDDLLDHYFGG
jgi:thiol-disulfide isomerase/thioredoxin